MHKISIEDIERKGSVEYEFEGNIDELHDCELCASIRFRNMGDFVNVKGHANGKITLECDRCLNDYVHHLDFDINESFAKNSLMDEYGQELELSENQFITDLNGADEIDVYDLLYQSVILALPNKKVCGINCNEGTFVSEDDIKIHDSRMDVFKNIQIEKGE